MYHITNLFLSIYAYNSKKNNNRVGRQFVGNAGTLSKVPSRCACTTSLCTHQIGFAFRATSLIAQRDGLVHAQRGAEAHQEAGAARVRMYIHVRCAGMEGGTGRPQVDTRD
jgi:hypothetical protein